jgi:hypothetical protein
VQGLASEPVLERYARNEAALTDAQAEAAANTRTFLIAWLYRKVVSR